MGIDDFVLALIDFAIPLGKIFYYLFIGPPMALLWWMLKGFATSIREEYEHHMVRNVLTFLFLLALLLLWLFF